MKKFLVTYFATGEIVNQMAQASAEEIAAATKPWMDWQAANEKNIVDFGSRLFNGQERSANSEWNQQAKIATGYSILQGSNMEEIKSILATHPQLVWNPACSLSVQEFSNKV